MYKGQENSKKSQVFAERFKLHCEKECKDKDLTIIIEWENRFLPILQKANEDEINFSAIEEYLLRFQRSITKTDYPPIEFVIGDNIIFHLFKFLKEPLPNSIKIRCIAVVDCFITYLKSSLIDLISLDLIQSLLTFLLDKDIQQDWDYPKFAYNITKIFKTSSVYSEPFAIKLYNTPFLTDFVEKFLVTYDLQYINNYPNEHDTILTTFIYFTEIFQIWCELTNTIPDQFIDKLVEYFFILFKLEDEKVDDSICRLILQTIDKRTNFLTILTQRNFFIIIWNAIKNQIMIPKGMDVLATGLIIDGISQKNIASFIDVDFILSISIKYFNLSKNAFPDDKKNMEIILEASIALIANFIDYTKKIPANVSSPECLAFIQEMLADSNYSVKDCASFLILELLANNNFMEIDKIYPSNFIVLFFDAISSGSDDVISKAIEVFEGFLNKASKINYNIYNSNFLGNLVPDFFEVVSEMEQFSTQADALLTQYYPDDSDDADNDYVV